MQGSPSIYFRCRSLFQFYERPERWLNGGLNGLMTRRFRSGGSSGSGGDYSKPSTHKFSPGRPPQRRQQAQTPLHVDEVVEYFESRVKSWARSPRLHQRLDDFGIPSPDAQNLLHEFTQRVQRGELSTPEIREKYYLDRLSKNAADLPIGTLADRVYTNVLFSWATDPANRQFLDTIISPSTLDSIENLVTAVDASYPAENFQLARRMRRKVIMHVGPTNSGKTYNALRALAAARVGIYAGPLRLLAHEIWERLNLGQILPLGAENEPTEDLVDDTIDVGDGKPAVHKNGDPRYARLCNLITGEEQKFVSDLAPLTSATVEMISFHQKYDVAVVDEVQMLADEYRGGGWTNAILGIAAKELHLCGEETAVPIVEAMLKGTGDELIVNRYQRLAPLSIEPHSLRGDLSKIRKGDCMVTFSRKGVFGLKRKVEEVTGLRCAVVYGRLPPEVRNSQAALFNDQDSGYDVLIGSDAIGMGLNLKIKRVILESVDKFDGVQERPLSLSQTKQIAGRAGRYGAHKDGDENVGLVATVREQDMPFLRRAIAAPFEPLKAARQNPTLASWQEAATALPPGASFRTMIDVHRFCARTNPIFEFCEINNIDTISEFVDTYASDFTTAEKFTIVMAPIPWRDRRLIEVIGDFMTKYREKFQVDLVSCLEETMYIKALRETEVKMTEGGQPKSNVQALDVLETLHKILVLYMWMSMRHPVAWSSHDDVSKLKARTEVALEWSLEGLTEAQELMGHHVGREPRKEKISFSKRRDRKIVLP
ncbi:RNA helicase [Pleurotus ostreatus]|uniref:RNA helicase n=1 Tax=Pleurotus ostreatus TaxID=5322 RepID=A0A8H7DYU9_PLEOS|nr:RNA helicase [Pleurotus ostreatus]KAF7441248.1 RNA helicase [Pleurotus ostreatus]KAJ8699237.1 RNA helicase [Pleurotus ostreatus]